MDEKETLIQQPHSSPAPPATNKNDKFFSVFGKIILVLIIAGGLLYGGYYFATQTNQKTASQPTPSSSQEKTVMTKPTENAEQIPSPSVTTTKTIKAGLSSGATSFKPYSIAVPEGWTESRETNQAAGIDKLTITKTGYSLVVYQAPFGGGGCIYKGDPEAQMAQKFTEFVQIGAEFRRSWNPENGKPLAYSVCQKAPDNSYGSITKFGAISATSPNPSDLAIMNEVDTMIASLKAE